MSVNGHTSLRNEVCFFILSVTLHHFALVYIKNLPYLCIVNLFTHVRKYSLIVNIAKTIAFGAGGYLLSNLLNKSQISQLKDELATEQANNVDLDMQLEQEKNKEGGELRNDLVCFLTIYAARVDWTGNTWNTGYDLTIKNVGTVKRSISAIRVFWTCLGRKSTWSPWTDSPYVIKPGEQITIRLYGAYLKRHFNTVADIQAIEQVIRKDGMRKDDGAAFNYEIPITCEAEFILSANGRNFLQTLKDFSGKIISRRGERIYYPYRTVSGENAEIINKTIEKINE